MKESSSSSDEYFETALDDFETEIKMALNPDTENAVPPKARLVALEIRKLSVEEQNWVLVHLSDLVHLLISHNDTNDSGTDTDIDANFVRNKIQQLLKNLSTTEKNETAIDDEPLKQPDSVLRSDTTHSNRGQNSKKIVKAFFIACFLISVFWILREIRSADSHDTTASRQKVHTSLSPAVMGKESNKNAISDTLARERETFDCKTSIWRIVVDGIGSGSMRYRSWKVSSSINSNPEKTVSGGLLSLGDYSVCSDDIMEFKGDEVWTYIVRRYTCDKITSMNKGLLIIKKRGAKHSEHFCLR
jgi:hypothetical protein